MEPSVGDGPTRQGPRLAGLPLGVAAAALGIVALAVLAVVWQRAPVAQQACPEIAYSSVLEVTLGGRTSDVAVLQVRDGERWQPPFPPDARVPAIPTTHDGDTWTFTLFSTPRAVMLRALDDGGDVLAQAEVDVRWVRVGGTAECGGPMEAEATWAL